MELETYDKILNELKVSTNDLQIDTIQAILKQAKQNTFNKNIDSYWNNVADRLWEHLNFGFKKFDDQLLCATCFCTVITITDKQDFYIKELTRVIEEELSIRQNGKEPLKTYAVVSLMYGMFQSTFLNHNTYVLQKASLLKSTFEILLQLGYNYSLFTFITFKIMKLFQKVIGTDLQYYIFNKENNLRLLNLVNHNWENPVTGVRDLNRSIFSTILRTLEDEIFYTVLNEINGFYWNKAKYLMLSEVIEHQTGNLNYSMLRNIWIDGLIHSLHKPGLVSAGADMYYIILKQIDFEGDWSDIFLEPVIKILNDTNTTAIENFTNFWCTPTIKKFRGVFYILTERLNDLKESEQNLYSKLCIINQAARLGYVKNDWLPTELSYIEMSVLKGIEHCNSYIRRNAFNIVLASAKKFVLSELEYNLILDFLNNNMNSDCSTLRTCMLNSFHTFLSELHTIFLNDMVKHGKPQDSPEFFEFCKKLQNIIINSVNLNGNYQRKITCVKLFNSILSCLSEVPTKSKGPARKAQTTLIDYLKENGCWYLSTEHFVTKLVSLLKDPTDDVRDTVIKLLLNYYSTELKEPNVMKQLVKDALECKKSKFFYEIRCGESIFKILTSFVLRDKHSMEEFRSVEDIFNYAYDELITEYKAETNVMKSIETGKQLHSIMSILLVVLVTCLSNSYEIDISSKMSELIEVLGSISNQFGWEEDNTSSDFAKMNAMVKDIIFKYGLNSSDDNDLTKISGLHQIVLNCLWLNVKACCDLASFLVPYTRDDANTCKKCLSIITHVLETARHKGAIEAAGAALGRAIEFLTSLTEDYKISEVPNDLLKCKLDDLISETKTMPSVTRRGAGLSIMIHRIVSSDLRKGKPLFHQYIKSQIEICNTSEECDMENEENQIDLPKAVYIHLLTKVVADSRLASEMMFYYGDLAELAFNNLTSSHWQIRNAALQLYGALVPKLIGEKKASGSDEETTATVACDELRTHSPKLWEYIMAQLEHRYGIDELQSHSNLVPVLSLLANCAKRYNFSSDMAKQSMEDDYLLNNLVLLLGSPIYTVRRLTAKCIFNIYDFQKILDNILSHQLYGSENFLHGNLKLLQICKKYYSSNPDFQEKLSYLGKRINLIFCTRNCSYVSKKLFEELCLDLTSLHIEYTIQELNDNIYHAGVYQWAEARINCFLKTCLWSEVPNLLNILLIQSDYDRYCELIEWKLDNQPDTPEPVLLEIANILLSSRLYTSSNIWKLIFEISLKTDLSNHIDSAELLEHVEKEELTYVLRYIVPLLARNITSLQIENRVKLMKIIDKLSNFEISDVDMRYIAVLANNEIAYQFDNLPNSIKVTCIKCAVILLQDEDEDIRNLSVKFYTELNKQLADVQPYICLNKMLNSQFLISKFSGCKSSIKDLIKSLSEILKSGPIIDEYNPFSNESKNIYLEPNVLTQMIENLSVFISK